jgi:prefoldin subunit 5
MSELDTEARSAGNAAIVVLQVNLKTLQSRLHQLAAELAEVQGYVGEAQLEAAELRQLLERRQGGDSHGR